jgi:serine/threonine protein kinase
VKREEVTHFYAGITGRLLTAIRDAAKELVAAHSDKGLQVQAPEQAADGSVLSSGAIVITRSASDASFTWLLVLGFENGTEFDRCVAWTVPAGQFPSMQVPIKLNWDGRDQWGTPRPVDVSVPPIQLIRERISWLGKIWTNGADPDARWIVRTLLDGWLLQDSPEGAEQHALRTVPGGRWDRVRQLKAWGPNEVWEVRDRTDPAAPRCVMKLLRLGRGGPGSTAYKRIVREVEITQDLAATQSGIVPVLDFGIPEDGDGWMPFYVMPLAESTLAKAKDFKENLEGVLRLGIALADALAAAHERGVVHRDVKPDNILLLGEERRPVVADFGICFLATEEGDRLTATDAGTVGPANYVAPELLGGRAEAVDIDGRADVYSLGKTLYFAYSGGEIFPREYFANAEYDLRKRIDDPRVAHLYGLLERMVVEKRDGRFPSMAECRQALDRALENIKNGNPYESGMYGSAPTPLEIMERFSRDLRGTTGAGRSDLLRNALEDAAEELTASASRLDDSRPLAGAEELMMQAAFKGAERLMAVGLPLMAADDSDGCERWLEAVLNPLLYNGDRLSHRPTSVIQAASVLAFHGVALTALHRERLDLLHAMLDRYLEHTGRFVHLAMFGDKATRSWQWVAGCLPESTVLGRFEPRLVSQIPVLLAQVAGLGALLFFLTLDPDQLHRAIPDQDDLSIPTLPGLFPQGCEWVESLPEAFLAKRSLERAVADKVFKTSSQALRDACKRTTPQLARALRWTAGKLSMSSLWIGGIPRGGQWTAWCGGQI